MLMKNLFNWIAIINKYNREYRSPRLIRKFLGRRELHKTYVELLEYIKSKEYIDAEYVKEVADFLVHLRIYAYNEEYFNTYKILFVSSDMYMLINEKSISLDASVFSNEKVNFELRNKTVGAMHRAKVKEIKINVYDNYNRLSINILTNDKSDVLEATEKDKLDADECRSLKIQDINEEFKKFFIEQVDEYYLVFKKLL